MLANLKDADPPKFRELDFRDLIQSISASKRIRSCKEALAGDLLLRFDVDYSIFAVTPILRNLSEFKDLSASFYLLVDSNQYNIFSRFSRIALEKIAENGHEIGLHFNPTVGERRQEILQTDFDRQMDLLEISLGWRATSYSTHNPSTNGFFTAAGEVRNLYGERYFSPDRYVSDSSHTDPKRILKIIDLHDDAICQLLLHPENFLGLNASYINNLSIHFETMYQEFISDFNINKKMMIELDKYSFLKDLLMDGTD